VSARVPEHVTDPRDQAAELYDRTADELQLAAEHCRVAAQHFRDRLVPRGAAHAWAARGHLLNAVSLLDEQAREHASRSVPRGD
jgi:hypothetical protein